jgi:hypothetical protein
MLLLTAIAAFTCAAPASAQSASVYYAGGTAMDSSIGPINTLGGGTVYNTPRMGGFFDTIGGQVMFPFHNLGVGAEVSFRNGKASYAGLQYRPIFYDINAVHQWHFGKFTPEVQGGFGRANINLYYTPQFCSGYPEGCINSTGAAHGADYAQLHFGGGVRYYVHKDFFVRPQVDIRWVHNMNFFGSSWVPEYSVAIGYTFHLPGLK